jgi:hypothetical protein
METQGAGSVLRRCFQRHSEKKAWPNPKIPVFPTKDLYSAPIQHASSEDGDCHAQIEHKSVYTDTSRFGQLWSSRAATNHRCHFEQIGAKAKHLRQCFQSGGDEQVRFRYHVQTMRIDQSVVEHSRKGIGYLHNHQTPSCLHNPVPLPLDPLVVPLPIPLAGLLVPIEPPRPIELVFPLILVLPAATYPEDTAPPALAPLPRPLVDVLLVTLLPIALSLTIRLLSSSSASLAAAAFRSCSSASLLSASRCRAYISCSASAMSCVVLPQFGLRMSRWLCSVCERIRVHVCMSWVADETVLFTLDMLDFAFLRDSMTPSIASLTLRTLASSARRAASRAWVSS